MEEKGFFGKLFDTSFSEFITPGIIKLLFILGIVGSGIAAIMLLLGSFKGGGLGIVVGLVVAPIAFVLYVIGARIWCELIMIMFRIAENTTLIAGGKKEEVSPSDAGASE